MLPTGFRTFHFVSFLYVFFFSFLFLLFRFFSHYFVFVFYVSFFFVSFRYFSPCFLFVFFFFPFLFVSFRFFPFLSLQVPVDNSSANTIQMKSSMTFIQSNGWTEIDLILKQIWRRFILWQVSFYYIQVKQISVIHWYAENHQGQKLLNVPRIWCHETSQYFCGRIGSSIKFYICYFASLTVKMMQMKIIVL